MIKRKAYCALCEKEVDLVIIDKKQRYYDENMDVEYNGKIAICPVCEEELFCDDINVYNERKIDEAYRIKYEIISKEEILEIMNKYNIGKRPLSLLLGFGEITITRYLGEYVPTLKNSQLLKSILYSPSDYYSILQMNKKNIKSIAFKKSEEAVNKLLGIKLEDPTIIEVSKYIVNKIETTNMALQKILYYIQMFYMAIYKKHAFTSKCSAWEYGPVFGTIYYKYKSFNKNIIEDEDTKIIFDEDLKSTIDNVIKYFGCYTGVVLKDFTHNEKLWKDAINKDDKIIEKSAIKEFGEEILVEYKIENITQINKYSEKMLKIINQQK